jgi:hypothetical protein
MPTIPLNPLAFLSEWLALRVVEMDSACRHLRPKRMGSTFRLGLRSEAQFSHNENSISNAVGWTPIVLSAFSRGNRAAPSLLSCNSETV